MIPDPSTKSTESVIQWADEQPRTERPDPARDDNERRRSFFDEAGGFTPLVATEGSEDRLLLVSTDDRALGRLAFCKGQHGSIRVVRRAQQVIRRIHRRSQSPLTFVDLGAGDGVTTVEVVQSLGFARGIAVEPHPSKVRVLRANVALNEASNVETIHGDPAAAVGAGYKRSRSGEWRRSDDPVSRSAIAKGRAATVSSCTLDDLFERDLLDDTTRGLIWVGAGTEALGMLQHATRLAPARLPVVLEFDPAEYKTGEAFDALEALVTERFSAVVDLSLNLRDAIVTDASLLRSLTERYAQARGRQTTHLLLSHVG